MSDVPQEKSELKPCTELRFFLDYANHNAEADGLIPEVKRLNAVASVLINRVNGRPRLEVMIHGGITFLEIEKLIGGIIKRRNLQPSQPTSAK